MVKGDTSKTIIVGGIAALGLLLLLKGKSKSSEAGGEGSLGGTDPLSSGMGAGNSFASIPSTIPVETQDLAKFNPRFYPETGRDPQVTSIEAVDLSQNIFSPKNLALGGLSFIPSKISSGAEKITNKALSKQAENLPNPKKSQNIVVKELATEGTTLGNQPLTKRLAKFANVRGASTLLPSFLGVGSGIALDASSGESIEQASASNLAGEIGGGVGAAIGTFAIPIPVAGTAIGYIGGQIITDVGTDILYEKYNPDIVNRIYQGLGFQGKIPTTLPQETGTITTVSAQELPAVQAYSQPVILTEFDKKVDMTNVQTKGNQTVATFTPESLAMNRSKTANISAKKAKTQIKVLDALKTRRETARKKAAEEASRKAAETKARSFIPRGSSGDPFIRDAKGRAIGSKQAVGTNRRGGLIFR